MRTEQEKQLKAMLKNAINMAKSATEFVSGLTIDESNIKGMTEAQAKEIKQQMDLIKKNTQKVEKEIEKLTNDSRRK